MTNKCMDTRQAFGAHAMQGLAGHWQHRCVLSTTNTTVLSTYQPAVFDQWQLNRTQSSEFFGNFEIKGSSNDYR
jgi:hypothetical protein